MYKKHIFTALFSILVIFSLSGGFALANDLEGPIKAVNIEQEEPLTDEEIQKLKEDVGLTEEMFTDFTITGLRTIIKYKRSNPQEPY